MKRTQEPKQKVKAKRKKRERIVLTSATRFVPGSPLPPDEPETWYLVGPQYPEVSVSTLGRVHNGRKILQSSNALNTTFCNESGDIKVVNIHNEIAAVFFGPRPKHHNVFFRDGDKWNRKLSNLTYDSHFEVLHVEHQTFRIGDPLPPDEPESWWTLGDSYPEVAVSTLGRVNRKGIILAQETNAGYKRVSLIDYDGRKIEQFVHVLIAKVFFGERPDNCDVAHADDVGTNNRLSNLSYQSKSDNCKQAQRKYRRSITATSTKGDVLHFESCQQAAQFFERTLTCITNYCKSKRGYPNEVILLMTLNGLLNLVVNP